MDIDALVIAAQAAAAGQEGSRPVGRGGLSLYRATRPSPPEHRVYQPVLSLVLQGEKSISSGERQLGFGRGQSLLIGVDLAVAARVTRADTAAPYLALSVRPDMDLLRALAAETAVRSAEPPGDGASFETAQADAMLRGAMGRLLALTPTPRAEAALAPLTLREIHWWMLEGPHGPLLRRLIRADGPAARIARAVALIRADPARAFRVADLAGAAGMSASAFHAHFRAVTATTPLQFQKRLRLIEARARVQAGAAVTDAALAAGYESPTHFSRDYRRLFGLPPRADRISAAAE
ncbi:MAG: AraC family transcriptional regulator N-terminal domain-containing protein [Salinarimonas sp.]